MTSLEEKLQIQLKKRYDNNSLRQLPSINHLKDFCSNDYLGLARNQELYSLINEQHHNSDLINKNGSTGSRLISGNLPVFEETEQFLANIFQTETALLFNSGYTANTGLLSSIPQKGDTILFDNHSHACIKEGVRLNYASHYPFKHNDLKDLNRKIEKASGNIFIVVESVYSMDGDEAPLEELVEICRKNKAYLIVDEAHSTGVFGNKGGGLLQQKGLKKDIFATIHTFGKAMGCHGAAVACSKIVKDYLINFSKQFIYTTALPPHSVIGIKTSFNYLLNNLNLIDQLKEKINTFKRNLKSNDRLIVSESAIQAIIYPGNNNVKALANHIKNNGFDVKPILAPTIKEGQERLRICLHNFNSNEDIYNLTYILNKQLI